MYKLIEYVNKLFVLLINAIRFCFVNKVKYYETKWNKKVGYKTKNKIASQNSDMSYAIGIITDPMGVFKYYVQACDELKVNYQLFDIMDNEWYNKIVLDPFISGFLISPRYYNNAWRNMYDERLKIISESGKILYPSIEELWIYESKRRMSYWLNLYKFKGPKTDIFYSYIEAIKFTETLQFPIVIKADAGYGSKGVKIFKYKKGLKRFVKKHFNKGLVMNIGGYIPQIEQGFIIFQEYIYTNVEWRLVRIGESFFAHEKLKKGDFHSGTGLAGWHPPQRKHLDLIKKVTDVGNLNNISLDVFETKNGELLINEIQTLFGQQRDYQMIINGEPGRYLYNHDQDSWYFEKGDFCRNKCCNLRVQDILNKIGVEISLPVGEPDNIVKEEDKLESIKSFIRYNLN